MYEYVYVVFLVDYVPTMLNGFMPLIVESCEQALPSLSVVVENVKEKSQTITDYNLNCFIGTPEEFKEHLKGFEFKPQA